MADLFKEMNDLYKEGVEQMMEKEVRITALQIFNQIVERTPVDTGRARANWNIDINTVDLTLHDPGRDATNESLTATARFKLTDTIYISNNLPYIERLDEGHSKQAPAGFIDAAIETGKRQADEITGKI
jgi:hypothetical protein